MLPILNPTNLVIYGSHMPPLLQWLPAYPRPHCRDRCDVLLCAPSAVRSINTSPKKYRGRR